MKNIAIIFALLLFSIHSFAAAPVLFFSDLDSGPKTGGENNKGVYVTVWGTNFGASGTITVGGGAVDNYPVWTCSTGNPVAPCKATFQLGSLVSSGNIVMTTSGGTSNSLSFTVRSGNIYFLDPNTGNNSNPGTVASPWATYDKAVQTMVAGDTTYVRASTVTALSTINSRAQLTLYGDGDAINGNKAILAYPAETVVLGSDSSTQAQPKRPTFTVNGTPGSTSITYAIVAHYTTYANAAGPTDVVTTANATLNSTNYVTITIDYMPTATSCDVYRTATTGTSPTTTGIIGNVNCASGVTTLNDTGLAGNGASLPATVGCNPCYTVQANNPNVAAANYWTVSGLELHGYNAAIGVQGLISADGLTLYPAAHYRIIGNRATCPWKANDQLACTFFSQEDEDIKYFGNEIFNVGTSLASGADKYEHMVYFGTDDHDVDAGWNWVHDGHACRGIQFHSSPIYGGSSDPTGVQLYNLKIHDNWIENTGCDGINVATVDPSLGYVQIYNNVLKTIGTGLHTGDATGGAALNVPAYTNKTFTGTGTWSADTTTNDIVGVGTHFTTELQHGWSLFIAANADAWFIQTITDDTHAHAYPGTPHLYGNPSGVATVYRKDGRGTIYFWNNTIYDSGNGGTLGGTPYGAISRTNTTGAGFFSPELLTDLSNNVVYQINSHPCITQGYTAASALLQGSNNIWFQCSDGAPTQTTTNRTTDPLFVSTSNFNLQSGSPAIANGVNTNPPVTTDITGFSRPNPPAIGAYEYQTGAPSSNGSIQTPNTIRTTGTVTQ